MSTPQEMYDRLLNVYVLNGQDRRYYRAAFRRALLEHDIAVIEEYAYGGSGLESHTEAYTGFTDAECDPGLEPVKLTAAARARLGL